MEEITLSIYLFITLLLISPLLAIVGYWGYLKLKRIWVRTRIAWLMARVGWIKVKVWFRQAFNIKANKPTPEQWKKFLEQHLPEESINTEQK